jgi:CcmD family protein
MKLEGYATLSHRSLEALTDVARLDQGAKESAPSDNARRDGWTAVEGGRETMSGELLLVEAYAAVWIVLFWFVFASWRRQARIDARVDELERAVSRGHGK